MHRVHRVNPNLELCFLLQNASWKIKIFNSACNTVASIAHSNKNALYLQSPFYHFIKFDL